MNGAYSEEKKLKIDRYIDFGVRGVSKKNDQPGHTGALLVGMPRSQYETFIAVV